MSDNDRNSKLSEIEEAVINRLHFFTVQSKTAPGTNPWNREAIVQLSEALKNITSVKLLNKDE